MTPTMGDELIMPIDLLSMWLTRRKPRPRKLRMKSGTLTKRQREVLEALRLFIETNSYAPSVRELGELLGLHSPATVHAHIKSLIQKGYLERTGSPRSIKLKCP